MGDGGDGGDPFDDGQDRLTLLGKMLRIDIDNGDPYAIPADNPFAMDDFTLDEIWAIGLRNPWRFSFDRLTGDLWIADVGQDDWEEINFQAADSNGGENYGWRCYEGFDPFNLFGCPGQNTFTEPIHAYANSFSVGCSVTGGFVYRGTDYPDLYGHYVYADYCTGRFWTIAPDGNGGWINTPQMNRNNQEFSSFGEDKNGEIYVTGYGSGNIYRLTELCSNFSIELTATEETCAGDGNGSIDLSTTAPNGLPVFLWSNGDVQEDLENINAGIYSVTVTDESGCERLAEIEVVSTFPPIDPPSISASDEFILSVPDVYATYQWFLFGDPIVGATSASVDALDTGEGDYTVQVTDENGCTVFSEKFGVIFPATEEQLRIADLVIAPNPFKNAIQVAFEVKEKGAFSFKLLTTEGKLIKEFERELSGFWSETISIQGLPGGQYLFTIERDGMVLAKRLIKE